MLSAAGFTDVGPTRPSNQDSYLVKVADTSLGDVALVAVADGMGGLDKGELASAEAVRALSAWFDGSLPAALEAMGSRPAGFEQFVSAQLSGMIQDVNLRVLRYGMHRGIELGTTLTALLVSGGRYVLAQVGDSRCYEVRADRVRQLTEDQTLAQREARTGLLTEEEAAVHPDRDVLLQCLGSSKELEPVIQSGDWDPRAAYLLCSDGFAHELRPGELEARFSLGALASAGAERAIATMVRDLRDRGERDNVTAVVLTAAGEGDAS